MELNLNNINQLNDQLSNKIKFPLYNISQLKENTLKNPTWLHFGAGNIFRGFMGKVQQTLIEKGIENTGIIVAETFDTEIIDKVYTPFDNLSILVSLDKDGNFKSEILGSIIESLRTTDKDLKRLYEIVTTDSLQMISFTITEKGYKLKNPQGNYSNIIEEDFKNGNKNPKHLMSLVTSLLYERYKKNRKPISLVSMDNCSENGDKIKAAILDIAENWLKNNYIDFGFIEYLKDENTVAYPISMIDKITPRPAEVIKNYLENLGLNKMDIFITSKNSYVAPFINAETSEYFVVEDKFPNGRPKLEEAGIYITDRITVEKTEKMKVTTCLNPLHTTLAIFGCLLNQKTISEAINQPLLNKLVKKIGYDEALKVVDSPIILDPKAFINEVVDLRLPNPFIPDQPERIATDTSQKIGIRFGETIKSYMTSNDLDINDLKFIPLVIAGWFRYLLGVDDNGENRSISPDPLLKMLQSHLKGIELGKESSYHGQLLDILTNESIFGIDLVKIGMSDLIEKYFIEMIQGKKAVTKVLEKYLLNI